MHALLNKMEPKCFPIWNFTPEMQLCRLLLVSLVVSLWFHSPSFGESPLFQD